MPGMRGMRAIWVVGAGLAVVAAACGGGNDDSGGGSGTGSHEQMCELAWKDGGQQQAAASGQSKSDYMAACIRVMSGAATSTTVP